MENVIYNISKSAKFWSNQLQCWFIDALLTLYDNFKRSDLKTVVRSGRKHRIRLSSVKNYILLYLILWLLLNAKNYSEFSKKSCICIIYLALRNCV